MLKRKASSKEILMIARTMTGLVVVPVVSMMTRISDAEKLDQIWKARLRSEEKEKAGDTYHIIPQTRRGQLSMLVYFSGVILFLAGVVSGSGDWPYASVLAVAGMIIYFTGGYFRTLTN